MPKYDASGALEILGAYAEQKNPSASADAKEKAAQELLAEIRGFDKKMVDLAAAEDARNSAAVSFSFAGVRVAYASGEFHVLGGDGKMLVPIRFNRARGVFEGMALHDTRVPVPGERKQRHRDALEVIAEAIVAVTKKAG